LFYADACQLPEIFTDIVDFRIDPTWHEFESVECTVEAANSNTSLAEFIEAIEKTKPIF